MQEIFHTIWSEIRGTWRYRWFAMIGAWAICLIGWAVVLSMPDIYSARAQVLVDADSRLADVIGDVGVETGVGSRVFIVRQALLGRPLLERVARETELDLRATSDFAYDQLITSLSQDIVVQPGRTRQSQNLYTISFNDRDRDMAVSVVQSLLDTFVEDVLDLKAQGTEEVSGYLEEQLNHYGGLLSQAEIDLANFKKQYVGLLPGENGGIFDRLQTELEDLKELQGLLQIEEDRRSELRRQLSAENPYVVDDSGDGRGAPLPGSATESTIQELESQRSTLLLTFTERHPDIVAIDEQLEQLYEKRREDRQALADGGVGIEGVSNSNNPVYQSVQIALNESGVTIAELRSQIAQREREVRTLNDQINTIPEVEARFAQLNRDYGQYKSLYDELLLRKERERLGSASDTHDAVSFKIIDPPSAPLEPVSPKRLIMILGVLVVGLGAGGALAFLLHQINPVFQDATSLTKITGRPVLGVVSMTWMDRHRLSRRVDMSSFAASGLALVGCFALVILFNDSLVALMQFVMGGSSV